MKAQAEKCNFQEKDKMIRDKVIFTVPKHLKEKLLRDAEITLKKTIDICQVYEQTANNLREMKESETIERVTQGRNLKKTKPFKQGGRTATPRRYDPGPSSKTKGKDCKFCGKRHEFKKSKCPAWGKTCSHCGGRNHFKVKCKKAIHLLTEETDTSDEAWLNAIGDGKRRATACLKINNCEVRFQLDTAADVNTLQQRFVKKSQVIKSNQTLVMWNGTQMEPLGEAKLDVVNEKTGHSQW